MSTGRPNNVGSRRPETANIESRIASYEMAFRMQTSVPEVTDLSREPQRVLELYGPDVHKPQRTSGELRQE